MNNPFAGRTVTLEEVWWAYAVWERQRARILDELEHKCSVQIIKNPPPVDQTDDGEN